MKVITSSQQAILRPGNFDIRVFTRLFFESTPLIKTKCVYSRSNGIEREKVRSTSFSDSNTSRFYLAISSLSREISVSRGRRVRCKSQQDKKEFSYCCLRWKPRVLQSHPLSSIINCRLWQTSKKSMLEYKILKRNSTLRQDFRSIGTTKRASLQFVAQINIDRIQH